MTFRNFTLSLVICLLLCGPITLALVEKIGKAEFPSWLIGKDAMYLSGNMQVPRVKGHLSLSSFISEDMQRALEDKIDFYIPAKGDALLINSGLQFAAIQTSNSVFNYDCVPAFYGSDIVFSSEATGDRLFEMTQKATPELLNEYVSLIDSYESFAVRYPQKRFFLYYCPDTQNVAGTPSSQLISNPLTYDTIRSMFNEGTPSYVWVDGEVSYEDFSHNWYQTDHHWKIGAALEAYQRISEAMGFESSGRNDEFFTYPEPLFYGSLARRGLNDNIADEIEDACFDLPEYEITINGDSSSIKDLVHTDMYENHEWDSNAYVNRYAEYFHDDFGLIEFKNSEAANDRALLIVGDSYTNCIERVFAENFAVTYVFDPRHDQRSLAEIMNEYPSIDDVVFIMRGRLFISSVMRKALE